MMNQVDAEMGYSGRPVMMQQPVAAPVAEDDITGADLVRHALGALTHHLASALLS